MSPVVEGWIRSRICPTDSIDPLEFVARCNLGATSMLSLYAFASSVNGHGLWDEDDSPISDPSYERLLGSASLPAVAGPRSMHEQVQRRGSAFIQSIKICIKFLCISLTADPEHQRDPWDETDYEDEGGDAQPWNSHLWNNASRENIPANPQ